MTSEALKAAAYATWGAVLALAFWRAQRDRDIGLYDAVPRWLVVVVVVATIALAFALGAAISFESR